MTSKSESEGPITIEWGKEEIVVSQVARSLPEPSVVGDRTKLVRAGLASPEASLPEDAWHALARACMAPEAVALQLRPPAESSASLLLEEHVDGATLRSVHSRIWLSELFPGIQPRTGQEDYGVADPKVIGAAEGDRPQSILRYRYRNANHLRQHVWQTIHATIGLNSYEESILARRVTRALIVHPVIFEFEDGTEPISALLARDGITRLASAWKVLAGPGTSPDDVADLAVTALFKAVRQPAAEPVKSLTQLMALGREAYRKALREEFNSEWPAGHPSPRAVQIAQTYLVPAHVAVGVEADGNGVLAVADIFDDAVRSILASVHVEFRAWDEAAQNLEVATRALKLVAQTKGIEWGQEDSLKKIYALAAGTLDERATPEVYGDPRTPGTALWRAVRLLYSFTRPALYTALHDRAKAIKGDRRMAAKGFAGLLGPVIDVPWRIAKKSATKQARNAWSNGGVLCKDVLAEDWSPVPVDDFTTLVEPALKGDVDARCTLAVAGGIALIADKLLTRNVGSAVASAPAPGKVPFRADVNVVIGGLAREGNELGLWTLALAAQRFRTDRMPLNADVRKELGLTADSTTYRHVRVDLSAPDRIARTEGGEEELLTVWDVVWASDEERARKTTRPPVFTTEPRTSLFPDGGAGFGADPATDSSELSVGQQMAAQRRAFAASLRDARHHLDRLEELGQQVSGHELFGGAEEWTKLRENVLAILGHFPSGGPDSEESEEQDPLADDESDDEES
ncbi:hypothetical protein ACFVVL_21280 [Kitasatospora sp. NPDC058115]|uniref:hypothetical protein n=1 Tax=Kitasatospora sp. NPDC058115 TaxID=3346347 RepID=UPI0036DEEB2C